MIQQLNDSQFAPALNHSTSHFALNHSTKLFSLNHFSQFFLQYLQNSLNHSTKQVLVESFNAFFSLNDSTKTTCVEWFHVFSVEWFHQNYFRWLIFSLFHSTDQIPLYHLEIFVTCLRSPQINRLYFARIATFLEWLDSSLYKNTFCSTMRKSPSFSVQTPYGPISLRTCMRPSCC